MITNKDIEINNTSYTQKEFAQIYPELVDLTKKLTNKWDPEYTNESDPGLVLLKLLAFIGDKNNYNIDKNILEQFITSCTQDISMRNICEMLGYNIRYYRSATSDVSFTYNGGNTTLDDILNINQDAGDPLDGFGSFKLCAFDTSFITEDSIVYTLIEDIEITTDNRVSTKKVMQGQLKALNVSDSSTVEDATKIQLYNLDENNRIYFPESMVAENGIFINKLVYDENLQNDAWRRVDNLNDQRLGQKVFKFGYDSKKALPYIEFPSDIANLIDDGLEIYYLVSDGINGYVAPATLTKLNSYRFQSGEEEINITDLSEDNYTINNSNSVGAEDPETIDEAYSNFKKTVGTFDTLVSCSDYSNAIYNYQDDETNNYVVSNVQATDIRTDPNRSINILTRDVNGLTYYNNLILKDINGSLKVGTSYNDVILHGTKPFNSTINTKQKYNSTYNLLNDLDLITIEDAIVNNKTLSHILTRPQPDEIDLIENRYKLQVNISTKYKVNSVEQTSILGNVINALYQNFNARELEFGEEIPYDTIVKVIEDSDERIKSANVNDPEVTPYVVKGDGSISVFDGYDAHKKIVVDNILGGRIQLYIEDESYDLNYDMDLGSLQEYKNLGCIKGTFEVSPSETGQVLKPNENIQIVEDSYITELTYPAYIYYHFDSDSDTEVPDKIPYKLKSGEKLWFYYTDSSDTVRVVCYEEGTIIRCNGFTLKDRSNETEYAVRWLDETNKEVSNSQGGLFTIPMHALGTEESIEILRLNSVTLKENGQKCFWLTNPYISEVDGNLEINNENSDLIFTQDPDNPTLYFHILDESEFFIYPSSDMLALHTIGSGTKLQIEVKENTNTLGFVKDTDSTGKVTAYRLVRKTINDIISVDDLENTIDSESVGSFEQSFNWETVNFRNVNLHIIESSIYSFVEGENIKSTIAIKSEWKTMQAGDSITTDDASSSFTASNITYPKIRTVLQLTGTASDPQQVKEGQTIKVGYYDEGVSEDNIVNTTISTLKTVALSLNSYFQLNTAISASGNAILRSPAYSESNTSLEWDRVSFSVPYSLIRYNKFEDEDASQGEDSINKKFYEFIVENTGQGNYNATKQEYVFTLDSLKPILTDNKLKLNVSSFDNIYINMFDTSTGSTTLNKAVDDVVTLDFEEIIKNAGKGNVTVCIGIPKLLNINPSLDESKLEYIIAELKNYPQFDYLAEPNYSKLINNYDLVDSFFDYNNIYNPLTIAKIDFDNSTFKIVTSSRK